MLVKSISLALLAAVVSARNDGAGAVATRQKAKPDKSTGKADGEEFTAEDNARFTDYAAKNGKNYKSRDEFTKREKKWKENDDFIKKRNDENKGKVNGMKLAHNTLSDLTDEEFQQLLGLADDPEQKANAKSLTKGEDKEKGRKLQGTSVDHVALGHMTKVKNQGSCGSCWAFTANTVLEGTVSAINGTKPVPLSEQQLVDCNRAQVGVEEQRPYNRNFGCNGGWMTYAWYY